ncbi:transposase [Micromonospora sp. HUAS LYJ1]|nr:transposase [Micromonospora sp. HUAS LYJ1]WKU08658.1 transposase [Micromonospora sp. HUAS LYJ1]
MGRRRLQKPRHRTRRPPRRRRRDRHKDPQVKGFSVVKRRWVVERTIGWLMHHRRLVLDHETRPDNSASMITVAMIDNLAKRLTTETTPTWREPLEPQHA